MTDGFLPPLRLLGAALLPPPRRSSSPSLDVSKTQPHHPAALSHRPALLWVLLVGLSCLHPQPAPFCQDQRDWAPLAASTNPDKPSERPHSPCPTPSVQTCWLAGHCPIPPPHPAPLPPPQALLWGSSKTRAVCTSLGAPVCAYVCAHVCEYAHMCTHVRVHEQACGRVHVSTLVCARVHVGVCTCTTILRVHVGTHIHV